MRKGDRHYTIAAAKQIAVTNPDYSPMQAWQRARALRICNGGAESKRIFVQVYTATSKRS